MSSTTQQQRPEPIEDLVAAMRSRQAERNAEHEQTLEELAQKQARGEATTADVERLERALEATGKALKEFRTLVRRCEMENQSLDSYRLTVRGAAQGDNSLNPPELGQELDVRPEIAQRELRKRAAVRDHLQRLEDRDRERRIQETERNGRSSTPAGRRLLSNPPKVTFKDAHGRGYRTKPGELAEGEYPVTHVKGEHVIAKPEGNESSAAEPASTGG